MTALNEGASEAAVSSGVVCATDVTGFGLAGHLRDLAHASGLAAVMSTSSIPIIDGALRLLPAYATSNAETNRRYAGVEFSPGLDPREPMVEILFDPQSSGGLLLACPPSRLDALRMHLDMVGAESAPIGRLVDGRAGHIWIEA
jgi:selenide,water dikinase